MPTAVSHLSFIGSKQSRSRCSFKYPCVRPLGGGCQWVVLHLNFNCGRISLPARTPPAFHLHTKQPVSFSLTFRRDTHAVAADEFREAPQKKRRAAAAAAPLARRVTQLQSRSFPQNPHVNLHRRLLICFSAQLGYSEWRASQLISRATISRTSITRWRENRMRL